MEQFLDECKYAHTYKNKEQIHDSNQCNRGFTWFTDPTIYTSTLVYIISAKPLSCMVIVW